MIVTRTPFRITLGGGGTDLPSYYSQHGGFVFSMALNKYMYIMLNQPCVDDFIRLHYSESETVSHVSELKHGLAREALRYHGIERKLEISSMADLPAGTGVGSSSVYLVGLLTALHQYRRDFVSLQQIAEEACDIELNVLGKSVGKQDQYIATFGGLTTLTIAKDGTVEVARISISAGSMAAFVANTHIYYTGFRRDAPEVLSAQDSAMKSAAAPRHQTVSESLHRIKDLGYRIQDAIEAEDFDAWGLMLDEHWQNKKQLSPGVSLGLIDLVYDEVRREYGVLGGKIIGAGGGGFLMLDCPREHKRLERFMESRGMPRLDYALEPEGAKVVASFSSGPAQPRHVSSRENGRSPISQTALVR
ncbi:MAG: galactokinase [Dehalococcoidia bacterium]